MSKTLSSQVFDQLPPCTKRMVESEDHVVVVQQDKSTAWCKVFLLCGKYEEKCTVVLSPTGKVRKNSVRFYD